MKKIASYLLLVIGALALSACQSYFIVVGGDPASAGNNPTNSENQNSSQNPSGNSNDSSDGGNIGSLPVDKNPIKFLSDEIELPSTAQARTSWMATSYTSTYEFNADGDCTAIYSTYTLGNIDDYELANSHMESGGWTPEWTSDHLHFKIHTSMSLEWYDYDDAWDDMNEHFFAYTVTYTDNSTQYFEAPTQEQKNAKFTESFGADINAVESYSGFDSIELNYHYLRSFSLFGILTDNSVDNCIAAVNGYVQYLFDIYRLVSDDGTIRDYINNTQVITEAETIDNQFASSYFSFFKDGKECVVQVGIDNKEELKIEYYMTRRK